MSELTVSIAMTAYNNSEYLRLQLESILEQTVFPDEIVICEDKSTECEVKNILEDFRRRCPFSCRIEYNEQNLGNRLNYQKVYSLCSGDVLIQCDSDDIWAKTKVEKIKKVFQENSDVSLVFHDATIIDQVGKEIHDSFYHKIGMLPDIELDKEQFLLNSIAKHKYPYGMSMAIRKNILKEMLPFYLVQDQWIALCAPLFGRVSFIDEKLLQYRRHFKNESGNHVSIGARSKIGKIRETFLCKKKISRGRWFEWVNGTANDYEIYYNKFKQYLPKSIEMELMDIIAYGRKINRVIQKGRLTGVYTLITLYRSGLYQKYRGNHSQLILDCLFVC